MPVATTSSSPRTTRSSQFARPAGFIPHRGPSRQLASQPALVEWLRANANPDLVLDVRLTGVRPDELDVDTDEVESAVAPHVLKVRIRDASMPALSEGALPPADTILGAFIRDVEGRIAELEAGEKAADAAELRDALRLGRLLLAGHEVTL